MRGSPESSSPESGGGHGLPRGCSAGRFRTCLVLAPGEAGTGVHRAPPAHARVSCVPFTVSRQAGLRQGFRAPPHPSSRPPCNTSLPDNLLACGGLQACAGQRGPHRPLAIGGSMQHPLVALACSRSGFSRYKGSETWPTLAPGGEHCPALAAPAPHLGLRSCSHTCSDTPAAAPPGLTQKGPAPQSPV